MSLVPGLGIVKGMGLTLRRFFEPKVTVKYPEVRLDVPGKFRGRLQLLYDEWGTLKCETCFQCAQACPIECIDMGGIDTRGRFHVHWGAPETYGERREESALRRSGRPVPDPAYLPFAAVDLGARRRDPRGPRPRPGPACSTSSRRRRPRTATCRSPRSSASASAPGAWYAMIYGTATYYGHLRFEPETATDQAAAVAAHRPSETTYLAALEGALGGAAGSGRAGTGRPGAN